MNPEIFKTSIEKISEKIGEEQTAIIADDLGTLRTAQKQALDEIKNYQNKIAELETTNKQLVASNANLLNKIPVNDDNQLVPPSQIESQTETTSLSVDPFDEYGRLKK